MCAFVCVCVVHKCVCVCVYVCVSVCVFSKVRWEGGGMETGAEAETVQNHCCRVQHGLDSHFFPLSVFNFFLVLNVSPKPLPSSLTRPRFPFFPLSVFHSNFNFSMCCFNSFQCQVR